MMNSNSEKPGQGPPGTQAPPGQVPGDTARTTLIMVPATEMSTQALSSKHPILASQMESLITPCAAKCSMGPQLW